ncbi:MAG: TetR family transcriptional regulator [Alphaproteobacteria bacterium]|nr:TetR family transcriptional regulator [Alphaproteobacteria bacterium]
MSTHGHSTRDRIVDALMELAAERDWDRIEISDVAERAGVTLLEFREAFPSKGAVLGSFNRRIDQLVLGNDDKSLSDESTRDRIFDVLMRRFDALSPYKHALKRMAPSLARDPLTLAALNQAALNSMRFMLAAAAVETEGPVGAIKLQGAVLAYAKVMDVWFRDEDPGLSRTMAALDEELKRGGMVINRLEDLERMTQPLSGALHRMFERGMAMAKKDRAAHRADADLDPSI